MYSYGSPHTAAQKQDDQHERTFSSCVRIQDVVLKTCLGRWTIGRSGERGSGISVLPARYDDDDIYIYLLINYLPVFTVPEKKQKNPGQEQEKKISRITVQRKRKKVFWGKKKEKTNLVLLLEKNQGVLSQWPKENQKTLREYCNAIITKVLNIKQWSQFNMQILG